MAKGLRSKVKRRFRSVKRQHIDATLERERCKLANEKLLLVQKGISVDRPLPKNAFLFPDDPDAVFPQHKVVRPVDFRSEALPLSGFCGVGGRRKFDKDEKERIGRELGAVPGAWDAAARQLREEEADLRETVEEVVSLATMEFCDDPEEATTAGVGGGAAARLPHHHHPLVDDRVGSLGEDAETRLHGGEGRGGGGSGSGGATDGEAVAVGWKPPKLAFGRCPVQKDDGLREQRKQQGRRRTTTTAKQRLTGRSGRRRGVSKKKRR